MTKWYIYISIEVSRIKSKFDDPSIEDEVIEVLRTARMPVSIDYVAHHLEIGWDTARATLMNLTIQGKIKGQKTTKSLIFSLNDGDEK